MRNCSKVVEKIIYQKTNTLLFPSHKETDAKIDAEALTLETKGGALEDVF